MKLTLAELTAKLERAADEKEDIECRHDDAVAALWLILDQMVALDKKLAKLAKLIPGILKGSGDDG